MSKKSDDVKFRKKMLLKALRKERMNITSACESVGISRETFYTYQREDSTFRKRVDELREANIDWVESKLMNNIDKGSERSIEFFLRTQAKHRGYYEKVIQELEGQLIQINLSPEQADLLKKI